MNSAIQKRADAASDAYTNRSQGEVDKQRTVPLDGKEYSVFGYKDDPITGFHATAYKEVAPPHNIIIAYRGTDPDFKKHPGTMLQDIAVDATMVRDTINPQKAEASAFTQEMIAKAAQQGISKDHVSVAGHSLGGTLAEIEAAKFGLRGITLNAYGAVGMIDGPPLPGCQLTNYRMAGDPVSGANGHIGTVVSLASPEDVASLQAGRYLDAPAGSAPPNPLIAIRAGDHGGAHFNGTDGNINVLNPAVMAEYAQRYKEHQAAFDHLSGDLSRERGELSVALRQMESGQPSVHLPPDVQRQVNEYLAINADPSIREGIEHNARVQGVEHRLQDGADGVRAGSQYVQTQDERAAAAARTVGDVLLPVAPLAPLAGAVLGEMAHLEGQAAHAFGDNAASKLESLKQTVEQSAHNLSQTAQAAIHNPDVQARAVGVVNHIVDTYGRVAGTERAVEQSYNSAKQAVSHGIDATERAAGQAYDATKHAVSRGINAAEHGAAQAYDTLTDPTHWFDHASPPETPPALDTKQRTPTLSPPLDPPAMRDFRHPEHPLHPRYQMFRDALGEQGFHQDRPTLNAVPEVRGYSAEQKDRLAAGFTGQLGADQRFNTEIQHFSKDGEALLAVEHPDRIGDTPLVLSVDRSQTLARTPEAHTATWRARELPEQHAVNTARPDPHTLSPDHPGHPEHPRHAMFEHARDALAGEYARWGLQKGGEPLDRETLQVMTAARARNMDDVGAVRLWKGSPDGRIGEHPMLSVYDTAQGPQQSLSSPGVNVGLVKSQALQDAPPVPQAAQQFQAVDQQATQQVQQMQQMQAQVNAQRAQGQAMGGPGMGA